jgi:hypothetical protein
MKRGTDDDALSWGDENDPTYVAPDLDDTEDELVPEVVETAPSDAASAEAGVGVGVDVDAAGSPRWASAAPPAASVAEADRTAVSEARASQAEGAEDAAVDDELDDAEAANAQLSSAALITFGVIGGIFFLYTIGWLVAFIRNPLHPGGFAEVWQDVQGVAAIAAAPLWFLVTLFLAARRSVPVRLVWLIIGIVVLVPWPFILGV